MSNLTQSQIIDTFCNKETFLNEYGDREPACIGGYYYTDYVCPLFEKSNI